MNMLAGDVNSNKHNKNNKKEEGRAALKNIDNANASSADDEGTCSEPHAEVYVCHSTKEKGAKAHRILSLAEYWESNTATHVMIREMRYIVHIIYPPFLLYSRARPLQSKLRLEGSLQLDEQGIEFSPVSSVDSEFAVLSSHDVLNSGQLLSSNAVREVSPHQSHRIYPGSFRNNLA